MTRKSAFGSFSFVQSEAFKFARGTIGVSLGISAMVMVLGLLGNVFNQADVLSDERFVTAFSLVDHGMHRVEVFRRLGRPGYKSDGFYLGSREDFPTEYAAAAASPSNHYYVWYRNSDEIFTVGFSKDDIVTFKAAGRK
jgi:hypothetical protein